MWCSPSWISITTVSSASIIFDAEGSNMLKNENIKPRELTAEEEENRKKGIYDSFANYLTFCPACGYLDKSNMYLQSAERRLGDLLGKKIKCPVCGKCMWVRGYPDDTETGFVPFTRPYNGC